MQKHFNTCKVQHTHKVLLIPYFPIWSEADLVGKNQKQNKKKPKEKKPTKWRTKCLLELRQIHLLHCKLCPVKRHRWTQYELLKMDNDGLMFTKNSRPARLFGMRYQPLRLMVSQVRCWDSLATTEISRFIMEHSERVPHYSLSFNSAQNFLNFPQEFSATGILHLPSSTWIHIFLRLVPRTDTSI